MAHLGKEIKKRLLSLPHPLTDHCSFWHCHSDSPSYSFPPNHVTFGIARTFIWARVQECQMDLREAVWNKLSVRLTEIVKKLIEWYFLYLMAHQLYTTCTRFFGRGGVIVNCFVLNSSQTPSRTGRPYIPHMLANRIVHDSSWLERWLQEVPETWGRRVGNTGKSEEIRETRKTEPSWTHYPAHRFHAEKRYFQ